MAIKYDYNSGCFVFKRFLLSGKTDGTRSWCSILPLSKATKSCFLASLNLYLLNSGQLKKYLNADW